VRTVFMSKKISRCMDCNRPCLTACCDRCAPPDPAVLFARSFNGRPVERVPQKESDRESHRRRSGISRRYGNLLGGTAV
jgi:hypothetical protein